MPEKQTESGYIFEYVALGKWHAFSGIYKHVNENAENGRNIQNIHLSKVLPSEFYIVCCLSISTFV